jgi:hypothetical protein
LGHILLVSDQRSRIQFHWTGPFPNSRESVANFRIFQYVLYVYVG